VCLGLSFVVSALPTAKLEKKAGYERSGSNPMLVVRDQPAPATENKSTSHLKIVIISIAALIVVCALAFSLYRWRSVFARLFFKRQKRQPSVIITSPLGGFASVDHHRCAGTPSPMSESGHSEVLFGGYDMPARPVPAQKRVLQPTTLGTFFLAGDDELAPLTSSAPRAKVPSRKTKRRSLKVAIEPSPPPSNGSAEPDSPAAAKETTRFSWVSEKPKFRTVDSWVGNQAERWNPADAGEKTEDGGKTPVALEPSTPAVCRQHPGVPVELTRPERVNSTYLDRSLSERY